MRRTARRYWGGLIVVGLLVVPAYDSSDAPVGWSASEPVPFLTTALAQTRALQTLQSSATIPAISLTAPLPMAGGSPAPGPPSASRPTVRGSAASLVTPAVDVTSEGAHVIVREGQTLWEIALTHGVTVEALAAANGIGNDDVLQVGQRLAIPGKSAVSASATALPAAGAPRRTARQFSVVVGDGETLWEIAQTYGISVDAIVDANALPNGDLIRPGQRLVIPGGTADIPSRVTLSRRLGSAVSIAQSFIWPARGRLTSRFGWRWTRHHDGIDIAAPYGTQIYAAKAGRVVFAGWYYGYGRAVIIDHGNGVSTLYGHASRLLVRVGAQVEAGALIALVGATGDATGPHLHFEIRVNGRPLNPLKYL